MLDSLDELCDASSDDVLLSEDELDELKLDADTLDELDGDKLEELDGVLEELLCDASSEEVEECDSTSDDVLLTDEDEECDTSTEDVLDELGVEEDRLEELDCEEVELLDELDCDEDDEDIDELDESDELDCSSTVKPRKHRRKPNRWPPVKAATRISILICLATVQLAARAAVPLGMMSCRPNVPAVVITTVSRMSPAAPAAVSTFTKMVAAPAEVSGSTTEMTPSHTIVLAGSSTFRLIHPIPPPSVA